MGRRMCVGAEHEAVDEIDGKSSDCLFIACFLQFKGFQGVQVCDLGAEVAMCSVLIEENHMVDHCAE